MPVAPSLAPLPALPAPFDAGLRPEAPLVLYTHGTPNGWKVSVALEELGLDYSVVDLPISTNVQKQPWFLAINPNGRIPALHDRRLTGPDGGPVAIFESGAILLHLAETAGALLPTDPVERLQTLSWLMFQMGGVGPMMGQANVFYRYAPEKIPFAIERYQRESQRLLGVLDGQLARTRYLVGDQYTIADIANWCWAHTHVWSGVDVSGLPHLQRWMDELAARPAVRRGKAVPAEVKLRSPEDEARFAAEARKMLA
ncbi:MAG: disulfide reductase YfcG [Pseudomonadota bacterium]